MGLQLCQHRFWTGALKEALTGLSVVPQSLDPDKTSKFIPQSHPWAITCSLHCQVVAVCSITVVLRQQMPYTRLKRWFRDDFCSPHSCLEPFMGKSDNICFFRCLNPISFSHSPLSSPLRKSFACFDSSFILLVTLIALSDDTAAFKPFFSGAVSVQRSKGTVLSRLKPQNILSLLSTSPWNAAGFYLFLVWKG